MPTITVQLETPIRRTFRVEQVAGMLDVPLEERAPAPWSAARPTATLRHTLTAEVPGLEERWTIGAIVGPSGSGKTTLARAAFGEAVYQPREWPQERAIVDCLGARQESDGTPTHCVGAPVPTTLTIKEIARVLTAVGLGSVPTWLKPYRVLSTGERFRADLARGVLSVQFSVFRGQESGGKSLLVVDEFTSTLDRTVAKTVSGALARLVRCQQPALRFVALSCHTDILPWLAPDWVVQLSGNEALPRLTWGEWNRPQFELEIRRVPQAMWARFARQHYLAGGLAASATCYAACWRDEPIAFCAVVAALGWKRTKRITRLVTLPEYQGLGIASRLAAEVAAIEAARGNRVTITASHPAIVGHCSRSPAWRLIGVKKHGSTRQRYAGRTIRCSIGRAVASFEFVAGS